MESGPQSHTETFSVTSKFLTPKRVVRESDLQSQEVHDSLTSL